MLQLIYDTYINEIDKNNKFIPKHKGQGNTQQAHNLKTSMQRHDVTSTVLWRHVPAW